MYTSPTLQWQKLLEIYYCIQPCYSVAWDIDSLYFAHNVAVNAHLTVLALLAKNVPFPSVVDVYAATGLKLWSLVYNATPQDHIATCCFRNEDLVVVFSTGKYRVYTDFAGTFDEGDVGGSIPLRGPDPVITDLQLPFEPLRSWCHAGYLVVQTKSGLLFVDLATDARFSLAVTGAAVAFLDGLTLLVSHGKTILEISVNCDEQLYEVTDHKLTEGPFSVVAVSPNSALVALFNADTAKIYVIPKTFDRVLLEYDTLNESSAPYMVQWAGNDAIILLLRDEVKLVGPGQKSILFFYDIIDHDFDIGQLISGNGHSGSFTVPILNTDAHGLYIFTGRKVEYLSRVPNASVELFLVGLTHPALALMDCLDSLELQALKADTSISYLASEKLLKGAIDTCLDAALEEFSPQLQRRILRAASFGKIYDEQCYDANHYLRVVNTVKALNQLRAPEVGLYFTHAKVASIGWDTVVEMLLRRSHHLLSLKLIHLLDLPGLTLKVYTHWCCAKIRKEMNTLDHDLFAVVSKKLDIGVVVPMAPIVEVAHQEGRVDLCKLLIDLESVAAEKVRLLLRINEQELALVKAFQLCDLDLCSLLLWHLKDTLTPSQFQRVLNQTERQDLPLEHVLSDLHVSGDLIKNFWLHLHGREPERMKEALVLEHDSSDYTHVYEAQKAKLQGLKHRLLPRELELLELKRKTSETFQQSFFHATSVVGVIEQLVAMHQLKPATRVAKDFKVLQTKLWSVIVETYCKTGEFERLHRFVQPLAGNPGVPMEEIAATVMAYDGPKEHIKEYIGHSAVSFGKRAALHLRNDDPDLAIDEAYKNKDAELLHHIGRVRRDERTQKLVREHLAQL